uniref:DUF19 domain-containing protein n=1 Tax=Globodera pallida TaxID=36090 RepID=A0A183C9Y2_GLOPA
MPQQLPLAFTHQQPMLNRTHNQTQPTAHIVDKETQLSTNSSAAVKCPKVEWHKIMEKAIKSDDPNTSIKQIQTELSRTEHGIFVVMCSLSNQREQFTKNLKLKGDDFCQLIKDNCSCATNGKCFVEIIDETAKCFDGAYGPVYDELKNMGTQTK